MAFFFGTESVRKSAGVQAIPTGSGRPTGCAVPRCRPGALVQPIQPLLAAKPSRVQRCHADHASSAHGSLRRDRPSGCKTRASVPLLPLWWLPWWIAASIPRAVGASICSSRSLGAKRPIEIQNKRRSRILSGRNRNPNPKCPGLFGKVGEGCIPHNSPIFFQKFL